MKRRFLVNYDDGTGGVWAYLLAESETQIGVQFPEFSVVHDPPAWLTDEVARRLEETLTLDIDDPSAPVLRQLLDSRT